MKQLLKHLQMQTLYLLSNTELQNKISNLAKSVDSNDGIQANTVSVTKIVDEYRDIERRKWNVIVFNVPVC